MHVYMLQSSLVTVSEVYSRQSLQSQQSEREGEKEGEKEGEEEEEEEGEKVGEEEGEEEGGNEEGEEEEDEEEEGEGEGELEEEGGEEGEEEEEEEQERKWPGEGGKHMSLSLPSSPSSGLSGGDTPTSDYLATEKADSDDFPESFQPIPAEKVCS